MGCLLLGGARVGGGRRQDEVCSKGCGGEAALASSLILNLDDKTACISRFFCLHFER
jgi:hypothetical protein